MNESMSGNVTHASLGLGYPYLLKCHRTISRKYKDLWIFLHIKKSLIPKICLKKRLVYCIVEVYGVFYSFVILEKSTVEFSCIYCGTIDRYPIVPLEQCYNREEIE